ncbi:hypothetical protein VM1G_11358 [Cytospora mali]|uniref:Uncharacterized protein n=1 Tax=Cytospora mali TaxID=578113 RepID=A0A194VNL0_CYTMA|nr:hypothetical protein VM1G_11358 [Valsa mali]
MALGPGLPSSTVQSHGYSQIPRSTGEKLSPLARETGGQAAVDSIPGPEATVPVSPSARFD